MPVSRPLAEDLARVLVELYTEAETRLAAGIARMLADDIEAPDWAVRKAVAVGGVRELTERIVRRLDSQSAAEVEQMLVLAYARGGKAALDELGRLGSAVPSQVTAIRRELPGSDAIQRLVFALVSTLRGTHLRIVRWSLDAYRTVVARASVGTLLGVQTRRRTAQVAWEQLLSQGITGFTDRAGRNWQLASYVEMATRTTVAQAAVEGHLDRLATAGLDLVIVSNAPQECALCRIWEGRVLTRTGVGGGRELQLPHTTRRGQLVTVDVAGSVAEAITAGLMHPNCFPAEVLVSAPSGVVAADARRYEGPLVVIHTAGGDELPVTPNHPVLTPEGWVAAGALQVGQSVLRYGLDVEDPALGAPDDEQVPTRIGDVFDALRQASPVPAFRVPVAPEQFHGDGFGSDVDVVLADGLLGNGPGQVGGDGQLIGGGVREGSLLADSPSLEVVDAAGHAPYGVVSGSDLRGSLLCRHGRPLAALSLAGVGAVAAPEQGSTDGGLGSSEPLGDLALRDASEVHLDRSLDPGGVALLGDPGGAELPVEGAAVDAHGGRDLVRALTGQVAPDRIVQVEVRREWSGHVYNLQAGEGWYTANGLVVSNCRHSLSAFLPGVTRAPTHTEDPEGDRNRQQLRYLERQVRHWKLRAAAAIDPAAQKTAKAKVRAYQARIREHVAATGLHRQSAREQIGTAR